MRNIQVKPVGECFCGCDTKPTEGNFFVSGHDKKAEGFLKRLLYGDENSVAKWLVDAGYGPGGKNLHDEFQALQASNAKDRMEFFALQSLNEMSRKPSVVEAVVFIGPAGTSWKPAKSPHGDPQPLRSSVLDIPQRGSIVAQGFDHPLTEREKKIVTTRFKGFTSMWLSHD